MVSRHGSNAFHGGAYYKHENSALNARDFFSPTKTPYIFHEFEAEVSGRDHQEPDVLLRRLDAPVDPARLVQDGIGPDRPDAAGQFQQFATIKDPTTGQPFPGNIIPSNRLSSVSHGGPESLLSDAEPWRSRGPVAQLRLDLHGITRICTKATGLSCASTTSSPTRITLYFRWMKRLTPYVTPGVVPLLFNTSARDHRQWVVSDTHVFSATRRQQLLVRASDRSSARRRGGEGRFAAGRRRRREGDRAAGRESERLPRRGIPGDDASAASPRCP